MSAAKQDHWQDHAFTMVCKVLVQMDLVAHRTSTKPHVDVVALGSEHFGLSPRQAGYCLELAHRFLAEVHAAWLKGEGLNSDDLVEQIKARRIAA